MLQSQGLSPCRCSPRRGCCLACGEGCGGGAGWHPRHPSALCVGSSTATWRPEAPTPAERAGGIIFPLVRRGHRTLPTTIYRATRTPEGPVQMARGTASEMHVGWWGGEKAKAGPSLSGGPRSETRGGCGLGNSWPWADKATNTAPPSGVHTWGDRGQQGLRTSGHMVKRMDFIRKARTPSTGLPCVPCMAHAQGTPGPGPFLRTG